MEVLGSILMGVGYIISTVFGIMILIKAFQTSVGWGICSLLVPFAALVFVIKHWDIAKKPFLLSLISIPFIIGGTVITGAAAVSAFNEGGGFENITIEQTSE